MKIKIGSQWIADGGMKIEIVEKLEHGRFRFKHLNGLMNGVVTGGWLTREFKAIK